MFTGIIEEIGIIKCVNSYDDFIQISIKTSKILENAKVGDSVSVNGACLTITSIDDCLFSVDIV